jgi:hypothetical protein
MSNFCDFVRGQKKNKLGRKKAREGSWLFLIQDPPIYIVFKMPLPPNPAQRTEYAPAHQICFLFCSDIK